MSLTLLMIRCPDAVAPERREVQGGEFSIGRGPDNDWVLADPERHLSKRHCRLALRAGQWQLADLSANGTFLNHGSAPLGPGAARPLHSGDRISFGAYEIEVAIQEKASASGPDYDVRSRNGRGRTETVAGFTPDMLDPFAEPVPRPFGDAEDPLLRGGGGMGQGDGGLGGHGPGGGIQLPADFDPLGEEDDPFHGPTQPDHSPAIDGAFRPPVRPASAIPDDWDLEMPAGVPAPAARVPVPDDDMPPVLRPVVSAPAPAPRAAPPPAAAPPETGLLAAFLDGAGLDEATPADPRHTMELAGASLRAAVSGIRQVLVARASVKAEFRIEQTMIQARGNNPLKFSASDDDALAALLGLGGRHAMPPTAALTEALRDMRLHELATLTAMQAAVRALLAQFDPAAIDLQTDKGGLAKLPGQRKARAWDAFEAMHAKVTQALSDDFDSVFGKAFTRAYEQAMRELSTQGDKP